MQWIFFCIITCSILLVFLFGRSLKTIDSNIFDYLHILWIRFEDKISGLEDEIVVLRQKALSPRRNRAGISNSFLDVSNCMFNYPHYYGHGYQGVRMVETGQLTRSSSGHHALPFHRRISVVNSPLPLHLALPRPNLRRRFTVVVRLAVAVQICHCLLTFLSSWPIGLSFFCLSDFTLLYFLVAPLYLIHYLKYSKF